jgi:hypothetical protein
MASHSQRLIEWTLSHSKELNLKITQLNWVDALYTEMHDFRVSIEVEHNTLVGAGTAKNIDTAFAKAIAEALERAVFLESKHSTSNGFAAHPIPEIARHKAKLELIERDAFFCHYLTKTPFLSIEENLLPGNIINVLSKLKIHNVDLRYYQMTTAKDLYSVLAIANLKNLDMGVIVGLGTNPSLDKAIVHATIECLRSLTPILENPINSNAITLKDFDHIIKPGPLDHSNLALSKCFGTQIEIALNNINTNSKATPPLYSDIVFDEIRPNSILLKTVPLYFYRASSHALQNLFFGNTTSQLVNISRLSHFLGKPIKFSDLQLLPHPLG